MRALLPGLALLLFSAIPLSAQDPTIPGPVIVDPISEAGPTWSEVREQGVGTLRVIYVPAEGFAYHDETGFLTGVSIEIVRDFATWLAIHRAVHLDLDFVPEGSWPHFLDRIRTGEGGVLGLGNVTITEERRREFQFSPPYLTNVAVLVTRDDVPELQRLVDLRELATTLRPLAFRGTLHEERLRHLVPEADLAFAASNDEIIERVAGGGYFAYIDAYNYFRAREQGLPVRRHEVADDPGEEFGFIMPFGVDWIQPLEAFFDHGEGYLRTDRYRSLLVEHLGEGVAGALLRR